MLLAPLASHRASCGHGRALGRMPQMSCPVIVLVNCKTMSIRPQRLAKMVDVTATTCLSSAVACRLVRFVFCHLCSHLVRWLAFCCDRAELGCNSSQGLARSCKAKVLYR